MQRFVESCHVSVLIVIFFSKSSFLACWYSRRCFCLKMKLRLKVLPKKWNSRPIIVFVVNNLIKLLTAIVCPVERIANISSMNSFILITIYRGERGTWPRRRDPVKSAAWLILFVATTSCKQLLWPVHHVSPTADAPQRVGSGGAIARDSSLND